MEEWLVPVISIEKASGKAKEKTTNKVILQDEELKIDSFTKMVTIEFRLEAPVTETVSVLVRGKRIVCEKCDGGYTFKYRPHEGETEATATVFVGSNEISKAKFSIRRPLTTNKKFDI